MRTTLKTIDEARDFVLREGIVGIFGSAKKSDLPALWDAVDLPEKQPGEKGWGKKVSAVWSWKNQLPSQWPEEIFYGKIKGGLAVLCSMDYLRDTLYPRAHVPVEECSPLAREMFEEIRLEPLTTPELKKRLELAGPANKAKFDRALKELQVTLNIVRLNDPDVEGDTWVPFREQYPEF